MSKQPKTQTIDIPPNTYVAQDSWGNCKACGRHQDLRMGACFACSEFINGYPIPGGHHLWDTRDPTKAWDVYDSGN